MNIFTQGESRFQGNFGFVEKKKSSDCEYGRKQLESLSSKLEIISQTLMLSLPSFSFLPSLFFLLFSFNFQ